MRVIFCPSKKEMSIYDNVFKQKKVCFTKNFFLICDIFIFISHFWFDTQKLESSGSNDEDIFHTHSSETE